MSKQHAARKPSGKKHRAPARKRPGASNRPAMRLALGGLLSALIFAFTYLIKVPAPPNGYIHLGDGMIFFAAQMMGPFAAICAGLGSALSDLLGAYSLYILPTFVIKAIMGALAGCLLPGANGLRRFLTLVFAEAMMVGGYALFEAFSFSPNAALIALPMNLVQAAAGVALGLPLCALGLRLGDATSRL